MDLPTPGAPAPRVLIVMPAHWPRALLRASLREVGYDAVGARDLVDAFRDPPDDRGLVRLIILDQDAVGGEDEPLLGDLLVRLRERHPAAGTVLIARATTRLPRGAWERVLRRPISMDGIVRAVEALVPLPPEARRPLD